MINVLMTFVNDSLNHSYHVGDCRSGDTALPVAARERFRELVQQAKARGDTQRRMAARIGEEPMWVTNRLTGHSQIHADDVPKIAEMFGMDICAFFVPERNTPPLPGLAERLESRITDVLQAFPDDEAQKVLAYLEIRARILELPDDVSDPTPLTP